MTEKYSFLEKMKLFIFLYHFKSCGFDSKFSLKRKELNGIRFFYEDKNFDKFFDTSIFINNSKLFFIRKYEKEILIE